MIDFPDGIGCREIQSKNKNNFSVTYQYPFKSVLEIFAVWLI